MSPPSRPKLTVRRLWDRRRAHYLAVFRRALILLRERGPLPEDEPHLNRELWFALGTARRELDPDGAFGIPCFEAQNPPDPDTDVIQPHEYKVPDVQWRHDDPAAVDDRYREKSFTVECKRLGLRTKGRVDLNKEYVISGIQRFRSLEHRYGMYMAEGAMLGYVQSMGLSAVHAAVCQYAAGEGTPPLLLQAHGWHPQSVTELTHQFDRGFPNSPFHLTHLWLDIQDIPTRPNRAPRGKARKKKKPQRGKKAASSRKRTSKTASKRVMS